MNNEMSMAKGCYAVRGRDPEATGLFGGWVWLRRDGSVGPEYVRGTRYRVARLSLDAARRLAARFGAERPGWNWTVIL